ncbi:hypothetical protein CCACVL1_12436 [Corchorus capsularis]|uniref:Uncharacterized protein n=1 Tax=Corchorus capsularis TaxID=210143 RepID=A0A1R3IFR0_COCAP|nr:hypothetical protein CCACVL1_12436 [Corchorus capsularis]
MAQFLKYHKYLTSWKLSTSTYILGLKTGTYYLRKHSAANAINFPVDTFVLKNENAKLVSNDVNTYITQALQLVLIRAYAQPKDQLQC